MEKTHTIMVSHDKYYWRKTYLHNKYNQAMRYTKVSDWGMLGFRFLCMIATGLSLVYTLHLFMLE